MTRSLPDTLYLGWLIFLRDFRLRYRRAALGPAWTLVPFLTAAALLILLGGALDLWPAEMEPAFGARVLAGLALFQLFADSVAAPLAIGRRARGIIAEAVFPPASLLAASFFQSTLLFLPRLPVVAACLAVLGLPPAQWAVVAASACALSAAGLALGSLLAAPGLVLTDVRYALPLLQSLLFLTAPIAYPAPESGLLAQLNRANPLTALAAAPLAPGAPPAAAWTVLALLAAAAAALALAARFHAGALRRVAPLL